MGTIAATIINVPCAKNILVCSNLKTVAIIPELIGNAKIITVHNADKSIDFVLLILIPQCFRSISTIHS